MTAPRTRRGGTRELVVAAVLGVATLIGLLCGGVGIALEVWTTPASTPAGSPAPRSVARPGETLPTRTGGPDDARPDAPSDAASNLLASLAGQRVIRCDLQEKLPGVLQVARVRGGPPEQAGDLTVPAGHARPEPGWSAGKAGTVLHVRVDPEATRIVVANARVGVWEIVAEPGDVGSSTPCSAARHLSGPVIVEMTPISETGALRPGSRVVVLGAASAPTPVGDDGTWTGTAPGWPAVLRVLPDGRGPDQWLLARAPDDVVPLDRDALDGFATAFSAATDEREALQGTLSDYAAAEGLSQAAAPPDGAP